MRDAEFVLASDVDNPLLGGNGAAAVYGPQKGASPADVAKLDDGLRHWSMTVADAMSVRVEPFGHSAAELPGAGAAGGVGIRGDGRAARAIAVGHRSAARTHGFLGQLAGARLVITGEGSLDAQTLHGKAPAGVAAAARAAGVPVIVVAGRNLLTENEESSAGISAVYTLLDLESDSSRCIAEASSLLRRLAHRIAEDWLMTGHLSW